MEIKMDKLAEVAKEVEKSVDVKKVVSESLKDGKVDLKKAAETIKGEITADEAKNIANKAKELL